MCVCVQASIGILEVLIYFEQVVSFKKKLLQNFRNLYNFFPIQFTIYNNYSPEILVKILH